jgi:hypothetical protein
VAKPDRPPGQRSLFDFGVKRVEKRPPPEVDRAEVEREMEALREARKQREAAAAAAKLAAKRPLGRPKGSGKKQGPAVPAAAEASPQQLAGEAGEARTPGSDIALDISGEASPSAPQPTPVSRRVWTADEKDFALKMLPICGDNLASTIAWLLANKHSIYGPHQGQQPATSEHLRYWRAAADKAELGIGHAGKGRTSILEPETLDAVKEAGR